jgi:hypothetical protein
MASWPRLPMTTKSYRRISRTCLKLQSVGRSRVAESGLKNEVGVDVSSRRGCV